jgi:hypothetical protein
MLKVPAYHPIIGLAIIDQEHPYRLQSIHAGLSSCADDAAETRFTGFPASWRSHADRIHFCAGNPNPNT